MPASMACVRNHCTHQKSSFMKALSAYHEMNKMSIQDLRGTRSAFLAFGRAVLSFFSLNALVERIKRKEHDRKYHAAAGYKPPSNSHHISPVNNQTGLTNMPACNIIVNMTISYGR